MEVFYDNISAGARMGTEYFKGVVYQDFTLSNDEDIKVVTGRCGDLIDRVEFKTTKGRKISFGTSKGGKKFKLKDPAGRVVRGFKVGFGGHLHSIGAFFAHRNYTPKPVPVPTPSPFPTPMPVPSPGSSFPVPTPAPMPVPTPSPFPTPGSAFPTPGSAFPTPTPVPTSIPAPAPVPTSFPVPTPVPTSFPVPTPVPIVPSFTQSNVAGKVHKDTVAFDDFTTHKATLTSTTSGRLSELRVIHNNNLVFGLEAIYETNGVTMSGGQHVGSEMDHTCINQSIPLALGETITGISGKHGNVIDSISITTSTGKIYTFGGSGGSFSYSLFIPAGKSVISIAGGVGGQLHNFSVYYC